VNKTRPYHLKALARELILSGMGTIMRAGLATVYQVAFAAALLWPAQSPRARRQRARHFALKARENTKKNGALGISLLANASILVFLASAGAGRPTRQNKPAITATVDKEGFLLRTTPGPQPPSGGGAAGAAGAIAAAAQEMLEPKNQAQSDLPPTAPLPIITTLAANAQHAGLTKPDWADLTRLTHGQLSRNPSSSNNSGTSHSTAGNANAEGSGQGGSGSGEDTGAGESPFPGLDELRGNGYGSGTGKKYGPRRDPFKDQKILLLYAQSALEAYESLSNVPFNREQAEKTQAVINALKEKNNVTIHNSTKNLATFAIPGDRDYVLTGIWVEKGRGVLLGHPLNPQEASIAIALKEELRNPTHDVVVVIHYHRWKGNRYSPDAIKETQVFSQYLQKSGIRLYMVQIDSMPYSAESLEVQNALAETGGGFFSAESFLKLIKANQNSRL
jgi:hypothetical protein